LNPYPTKPRLTFRSDGTFKLTVFSDLHYGENPWDDWGPEQDFNSTRLMKAVLKDEKPDYVVLNGDLITGENTFRENSTILIDEIVAPLNKAKVPFSSSHGNHDNQANITHAGEILREQKVAPLSYTRMAPSGVGGRGGPGNYWVPVSHAAPVLVLWFFDSRGGFSAGPNSTRLPDWVDPSVGDWIQSETRAMNAVWGPVEKRGAVAFVHIPPHVIILHVATDLQLGLDSKQNPGLNADLLDGVGSVQATTVASDSGKDDAFWDAVAKNIENLHAVISGHDHGNEWCARDRAKDVIFCFDKHSGYGGYTGDGWGHGVRNLLFRSADPRDGVETWIRLEAGETRARITLNKKY
ncbi:Metallo-dependent phosphatase-like protein, partial [Lyophyllum atratum]